MQDFLPTNQNLFDLFHLYAVSKADSVLQTFIK